MWRCSRTSPLMWARTGTCIAVHCEPPCGCGPTQPGDCDSIKARRLRTRRPRIVTADERFFAIRLGALRVSSEHWTELEREVMTDHRWWSQGELRSATEQVWPEDLADLLIKAGIWGAD